VAVLVALENNLLARGLANGFEWHDTLPGLQALSGTSHGLALPVLHSTLILALKCVGHVLVAAFMITFNFPPVRRYRVVRRAEIVFETSISATVHGRPATRKVLAIVGLDVAAIAASVAVCLRMLLILRVRAREEIHVVEAVPGATAV